MPIKDFLLQPGPRYTWRKVFLILLSSLLVLGTIEGFVWYYYQSGRLWIASKSTCMLEAIIQTGPPEHTVFLGEALGLFAGLPTPLMQFDLINGKERLLKTYAIKKAHLKIIKPNIIFVDYTLRQPLFQLGDYTNTFIDEEGVFFPKVPFYSPRRLPEIRLGKHAPSTPWGERIQPFHLQMAINILDLLGHRAIERIDLSQVEEGANGRRQIVVLLNKKRILRLTPKNYVQEISHYLVLEKIFLKNDPSQHVIDLRIPEVAYIVDSGDCQSKF